MCTSSAAMPALELNRAIRSLPLPLPVRLFSRLPRDPHHDSASSTEPRQISQGYLKPSRTHSNRVFERLRPRGTGSDKDLARDLQWRTHLHQDIPCHSLRHQSSDFRAYCVPTRRNSERRLGHRQFVRMAVWSAGVRSGDSGGFDMAGETSNVGDEEDGNGSWSCSSKYRIIAVT